MLVVVVVVAQVSRPCLGSSLRISFTMEDFTSAILAARWCAAAGRRRGASVRVSRVSLEPGVLTVLAPAAAAAAHLSWSYSVLYAGWGGLWGWGRAPQWRVAMMSASMEYGGS